MENEVHVQKNVDPLLNELLDMMHAYKSLLSGGRDRILELGGECDSVSTMVANDPALTRAKTILKENYGINFN